MADRLDDYERLVESLGRFSDRLESLVEQTAARNAITVTHTQEGMGGWGIAAVTACFFTYLALIIFAVWSIFQINNLTAWENVYGRDLAAIKGQIQQREKKP